MKRKLILTIVGVLAVGGLALGCWGRFGTGPETLRLPGVVENQQVRLSSKVGGRVARVAVAEGEVVEPGRPLVYFDVPELQAQREQTVARLAASYAELDRARNGARTEEKDATKAAVDSAAARLERLRAGARKEELDQARSDLESAEAELKRSAPELERTVQLLRGRAAARADYDAALAAQGRLQGMADSARAKLALLLAGTRPEEIAEAEAELARARANHKLLLAGTREEDIAAAEARVAELKARLHELDINLEEAVVRAPEKAVVEVVSVRKGDVVAAGQSVVRVLRAEDLWVKVFVPETDLGRVRLNQAVTVTIDAYPGRQFQGRVQQIASISEFTPRNVQSASERRHQVFAVKVRVTDPQGAFHSGMAAEVVLPLHD
jgi:multidrug resistance efflux pump